jgi:hypothetical protein
MGQSASVTPFTQREGIRGEDKYAATTFRRIELVDDDLTTLYAIFLKIKDKNPYPKIVDPESISKYFNVKNSDFVVKLFAAVDFDGNDAIDFKEFTLGLWNFLSLSTDFLPALVFHLYDPLKFNSIDMKEFKEMLEAIHGVKLSTFTLALNNIMKDLLLSNKDDGITVEKFGLLCVDNPFIVKPIVKLQNQLRKKIVGADFWKKLEFRRSASIKGNLRDVNYVYIVNEETEIWRKKDFELGIGRPYELSEAELAMKAAKDKLKDEKEELEVLRVKAMKEREEREAAEAKEREFTEEARQVKLLQDMLEANKDKQVSDEDFVAKNRVKMNTNEGREVDYKKGVMKVFDDYAETVFMTAEGKFVDPAVPIEAAAVFEFPGEEKFLFGVVTDNKKKEDKVVMINRDLSRRRIKGQDLARINSNFKFVGYSKLNLKTLPDQIRVRPNVQLLVLCNNKDLYPKVVHESEYTRGKWNSELHNLLFKDVKKGEDDYLEGLAKQRQEQADEEAQRVKDAMKVSQQDRVNQRVSGMLHKEKEKSNTRKSINLSQTKNLQLRKTMVSTNSAGNDLKTNLVKKTGSKRSTINEGMSKKSTGSGRATILAGGGEAMLPRVGAGGKLAPLRVPGEAR